jgi:hypothetical protein
MEHNWIFVYRFKTTWQEFCSKNSSIDEWLTQTNNKMAFESDDQDLKNYLYFHLQKWTSVIKLDSVKT